MTRKPTGELRRGWTTGACATAATKAGLLRLWGGDWPQSVGLVLPRGETPEFAVVPRGVGEGWAECGIVKDAGDDPDVTHRALIVVRVTLGGDGVVFRAGEGVGMVTKPGLPIGVGEPAINPVPRAMMDEIVAEVAGAFGMAPNVVIEVSVPGGADLALKTWNPRLGIVGGISILGTTGVVRPFSCAAWIASIHRGIDVAVATGAQHVAGCTGATSERVVQEMYGLPDTAMLDMGDFFGGLVKYLARHPVPRLTIGGGIGKIAKLAQGAVDLHSGRSQVDFVALAEMMGDQRLVGCNTALEALGMCPELGQVVAARALVRIETMVPGVVCDVVVIDRAGGVIGRAGA